MGKPKFVLKMNPGWQRKVLVQSPRYEAYMTSIGEQLRAAAIAIFEVRNIKTNEWRTSEMTPPKYVSSFRWRYRRATLTGKFSNVDPGWHLVEWGSHPGGNPEAYVPPYRVLTLAIQSIRG